MKEKILYPILFIFTLVSCSSQNGQKSFLKLLTHFETDGDYESVYVGEEFIYIITNLGADHNIKVKTMNRERNRYTGYSDSSLVQKDLDAFIKNIKGKTILNYSRIDTLLFKYDSIPGKEPFEFDKKITSNNLKVEIVLNKDYQYELHVNKENEKMTYNLMELEQYLPERFEFLLKDIDGDNVPEIFVFAFLTSGVHVAISTNIIKITED